MYVAAMPFLCLGSLGVAQSTTVKELMIWRVIQAIGAAGGGNLGPAVIGDIYKLEERGYVLLTRYWFCPSHLNIELRWAFF